MATNALCPRCTDVMRPWEHEGTRMLACGRCGGGLLTPAALGTALGPHVRPESWTDRGLAHLEGESALTCPAHGAQRPPMRGFTIRHEDERVEVDVCTECAAIWLDAGEGAQLRAIVDAVHAAERESLPPEVTRNGAQMDAFAQAVKSDDLLAGHVAVGATRRRAWVTIAIASLSLLVFVAVGDDSMVRTLAYAPSELGRGERLYGLLTHLFAHFGLGHIVVNVFFLAILGPSLERHLGPLFFAVLYFLAGTGGFLLHAAFTSRPDAPTLGASGAVAGLVGALLLEAPRQRALVGSSKAPTVFQTVLIATGWLVIEVLIPAVSDPGTAWLGHLGGFITGGLVMLAFRRAGLPRPVRPPARAPTPPSAPKRTLDAATRWISERPALSIPLLGVSFVAVLVLSMAYAQHRECDAARSRAARTLRAYADRAEALPPPPAGTFRFFEPPSPAEARAKAAALEAGHSVEHSILVGATQDPEADRLLQEAESLLWQSEFACDR